MFINPSNNKILVTILLIFIMVEYY